MALTYYSCVVATGATLSNEVDLSASDFTIFGIVVPTNTVWCGTTTCNVRLNMALTPSGTAGQTFYEIGYSNNPSTATSGFKAWEAGADTSAKLVICEAAQFARYVKVSLTQTATVSVTFHIVARNVR